MSFMSDLAGIVTANWELFVRGIGATIQLVVFSGAIGIALAIPLALARVSQTFGLRSFAYCYITLFRGTPLLAQLFLIYYGLAQFDWVKNSSFWPIFREAWPCALIALSLNLSAYVAEALRGGILAVPTGEKEAALAAGMGRFLLMRRIVLPRGLGIALPALSNELILQLKSTALVSTITLLDVTGAARRIVARTYSIDALLIAAIIYIVLTYTISFAFRRLERRMNRHLAV